MICLAVDLLVASDQPFQATVGLRKVMATQVSRLLSTLDGQAQVITRGLRQVKRLSRALSPRLKAAPDLDSASPEASFHCLK